MILEILAIWAVVGLSVFWFIKDEHTRKQAELDAAARVYARPSLKRLAVARLPASPTRPARRPVFSQSEIDQFGRLPKSGH